MSDRFEGGGCLTPTVGLEKSMLGVRPLRPEPHVAQQSRRDKLRVQQSSLPVTHLQELPNLLLNADLVQVRETRHCDLLHDPASMFSSDMLNFAGNTHLLERPSRQQEALFGVHSEQHSGKVSDTQSSNYWSMNYLGGSGSNVCNQSMLVVGSVASGNERSNSDVFPAPSCLQQKPAHIGYQDVQAALSSPNPPTQLSNQEPQCFTSPAFYQNTLQEVVSPGAASIGEQRFEMPTMVHHPSNRESSHCGWVGGGNELLLLPSYASQSGPLRVRNSSSLWNQSANSCYSQGNIGTIANDSTAQTLSLSLSSSHQPPRVGNFSSPQDPKSADTGYYSLYSKAQAAGATGGRVIGTSIQTVVSSTLDIRRTAGPLGPFTGYATILKNSKFLKPARQLLNEFCSVAESKVAEPCDERGSGEASISGDALNADTTVGYAPSFYSSTEPRSDAEGSRGAAYRPEFQRKKAKLLSMQDEVCRRYKQYHQQMQMVISSFETVAGLSAATPYTSLALKSISKHFRCLKNAITEQLRNFSKLLGEELASAAGTSYGDKMTPKLKFFEHGLGKQRFGEKLGFVDHQQPPVWRPQRGLPERAVAVLRAWLFEHFLHPYPTDTDKHMLAVQTGLSRNQVSNWFINARVRVWKPMVEEIHMLETKGSADMDINRAGSDGKQSNGGGPSVIETQEPLKQPDCSTVVAAIDNSPNVSSLEQWHREKRSKMEECQIPDMGAMGFMAYTNALDVGGPGAVSLTLGLRHSTDGFQQQHEQQLRHFTGHLVHDFAGQ